MTDQLNKYVNSRLPRIVVLLSFCLLLNACDGGGLGGSGDGGSNMQVVIPPSDASEQPVKLNHVPERLLAEFPLSLTKNIASTKQSLMQSRAVTKDSGSESIGQSFPYRKLTSTVQLLIAQKLDLGLVQLTIDANWDDIVTFCETTPDDTSCDFSDAEISSPYTQTMGQWETDLRVAIEKERLGIDGKLPIQTVSAIRNVVNTKLNTFLSIGKGTFKRMSSGIYQYEIVLDSSDGSTDHTLTLRWSDNHDHTFVSMANIENDDAMSFQSAIDRQSPAGGFNNAILLRNSAKEQREEYQLNLYNPDESSDSLQIESQLTEFGDSGKMDYYSIGKATRTGGYLSSQQKIEDSEGSKKSGFVRESFDEAARVKARSSCIDIQTESQCDLENAWEYHTFENPNLSQFFLTPSELRALEARLTPYELAIEGVTGDFDTLVLVKRANLRITITSDEQQVVVPGLGSLDLSNSTISYNPGNSADDSGKVHSYSDSVLCRVNKTFIDGTMDYHSFCAGSSRDIENAVVVSEYFNKGRLTIEWQANASAQIIKR